MIKLEPGEKYCPMDRHPWEIDSLCKKENCEWWNQQYKCCSIRLIGNSITGIARATK